MNKLCLGAAVLVSASMAAAQLPPIIDMHLHAGSPTDWGPPGRPICAPFEEWAPRDPRHPTEDLACKRKFHSPPTKAELRDRSIAELRRLNITAVASGDADVVEQWRRQAPDRIIPALGSSSGALPPPEEIRKLHTQGRIKVFGEIGAQYGGIAPNDPKLKPYYALAEELDIPVAIHIGFGPPGIAYSAAPRFRAAIGNPLLLEEILVGHPKLRLYAMHAGYPLIDQMIALMHAHPQVYVDTGVIGFVLPRREFHRYLQRLVDAGFAKRIMFGSDQMAWPETIAVSVEAIEDAPFLTPEQKRDILYNNAVRFLRLPNQGPAPAIPQNPERGR